MKNILFLMSAILLISCTSSNMPAGEDSFTERIIAGKDVYFENQTFESDIDFTQFERNLISESIYQVRIISSVTFVNCTFNGKVLAYKKSDDKSVTISSFQSNLSFINCEFNDEANFRASSIIGRTDFTTSAFSKEANFEECTFFQNAYFRGTTYHQELRFQNAVFMQKANFLDTEFDVTVSFQYAKFQSEAQFSNARFMGYTDFSSIRCFGNFFTSYAEFADRAFFNNSYFAGRAYFNSAKFNSCEMQDAQFLADTRFFETKVSKRISLNNSMFLFNIPDFSSIDPKNISTDNIKGPIE